MEQQDNFIKKYPYLAYSTNIMEYFAMIGYQEKYIKRIIATNQFKENLSSPSILFSTTSNTDFGIVDNKLIISQVYPDLPKLKLVNKNNINNAEDQFSSMIYSFCYDSLDGKEKLFYICYAYKFYEKYKYLGKKGHCLEFYVPKAFCIVSQYYYFTFFEYICKNLHILMKNKDIESIPVEITIYNIINFIPSPMNYSLNLDLFSYILTSEKEIEIKQLSGYPYLDFDLVQIFNVLPLNFIIEIYLLTIIEQSMLFFSYNLELLNMVMFIFFVLNYPCNDSPYFWHIVSISKDNFDEDNKFVGKVMASMLGVNSIYSEEVNTESFGKFNYIIDLDKKNIILKKEIEFSQEDDGKEFDDLTNFRTYIRNILKDKSVDSIFLKSFIDYLKKGLNNIISKEVDLKEKNINFFVSSEEIIEKNIKIQEMFYIFYINILMIFTQDNTLNSSYDKIITDKPEEIKKKILNMRNADEKKLNIGHEETYFCIMFRKCFKYKVYFENFIKCFESIDIFKIPLLFSQEFIYIKINDKQNEYTNKISLFKIIDALYIPDNSQTIKITLNNIFYNYMDRLKKYFEIFFSQKRINELEKQQLITLDKKILIKYIYLLHNFYEKEELSVLFPSITIQETSSIVSINSKNIINILKNVTEESGIMETKDYLIFALVYIVSIMLPLHSYIKILELLENLSKSLSKLKYFMPHYIYILMKSTLKFYVINKEKNIYNDFSASNIKMYIFILINLMRKHFLIPNEKMMEILNLFFGKLIFQERGNVSKVIKSTEKNYFLIEKNHNFFCFMKYNFSKRKIYSSKALIMHALKENRNCNINIIAAKNKIIQPKINIKINELIFEAELYTPKKVYRLIQSTFDDFFNENFDFEKLRITTVKEIIINLIQFGEEINQSENLIPTNFLIYSLYFLKDL